MTETVDRTRSAARAEALYTEAYARRYRAHDDDLPASEPSQALADWIGGVCRRFDRPIDALDLGCGTGRYFWALVGVRSVVGLDASPAMLAEARRPYRAEAVAVERVALVRGDLMRHAFQPAAFDLVYSIGVLAEHAPLTPALAARVAGWLRPGGRFAFTTVHPDSPSVPRPVARRLAARVAPVLPGAAGRALHARLMAGGLYADERWVASVLPSSLVIESMDRFVSEAHLHVRCVARKGDR